MRLDAGVYEPGVSTGSRGVRRSGAAESLTAQRRLRVGTGWGDVKVHGERIRARLTHPNMTEQPWVEAARDPSTPA